MPSYTIFLYSLLFSANGCASNLLKRAQHLLFSANHHLYQLFKPFPKNLPTLTMKSNSAGIIPSHKNKTL